jgi:hypothetical protein
MSDFQAIADRVEVSAARGARVRDQPGRVREGHRPFEIRVLIFCLFPDG